MSQLECAEGSVCRGFTADGVRKAVTVATEYGGREKGEGRETASAASVLDGEAPHRGGCGPQLPLVTIKGKS